MSTLNVDAPENNSGISLSYTLVDQVTGITQNGSTTSFTYDASGRRVNETVGTLTTVRQYSDSSDNPEWTTQQSGANLTTEIYTGSLGAGLAVTTTFKGTLRTSAMQLTDIRGHTVTTLDLDSNSVGAWSAYDSFGNPQTSQPNTNLINYSSYSQQERATNTTGLILMGARVYNPETNQFTSKDPIKGGNENSYTYPNDPLNGSDFSGLWSWEDTLDITLTVASFLPIPGIQQIAWIGKGILVGSKIASVVSKITKLQRFVSAGNKPMPKVAGVYEYLRDGKWYVGQTNNLARRIAEHERKFGKDVISNIRYKELNKSTAKTRRVHEQKQIDKRGGIDELHNAINAVRRK